MGTLGGIPIRVEHVPSPDDISIAKAIMHEIHALMERLLREGAGGTIDLRSLPAINPASLGLLEKRLSLGEVSAEVKAVGRTNVHETAYAGVWWLVHRNSREDIVTESIEVALVPDILKSQRNDIERSLKMLGSSLAAKSESN